MKITTILFAIILFNLLFITVSSSQEKIEWQTVYSLQLKIFKSDVVVLNSIISHNGTISYFPEEKTGYEIKVFSNDNKELFKANLGVSFKVIIDPIGAVEVNDSLVTPRVPFYSTAKYIAIYHSNKKIANIDLSKHFCNKNSMCDLGENQYICPEDCVVKKGITSWFYIFMGIAVISAISFLVLLKFRSKSQTYSSLYKKWK